MSFYVGVLTDDNTSVKKLAKGKTATEAFEAWLRQTLQSAKELDVDIPTFCETEVFLIVDSNGLQHGKILGISTPNIAGGVFLVELDQRNNNLFYDIGGNLVSHKKVYGHA